MKEYIVFLGLMALLAITAAFTIPASAHEMSGKSGAIVMNNGDLPKCPSWFQCRA